MSASAQLSEILFHPNGKMQVSNFQITDSLNVGLKKPFKGIVFNKLDSKFISDTSLLYNELKTLNLKANDSLEYFFFYNGTDSSIILYDYLPIVKIAQTKRGDLWPIMFLPGSLSLCGVVRNHDKTTISPGVVFIFKVNNNNTKGDFKTFAKLRMKTNKGIVTIRPFECYIDENSFYIKSDTEFENMLRLKTKEMIINFRRAAFLEK